MSALQFGFPMVGTLPDFGLEGIQIVYFLSFNIFLLLQLVLVKLQFIDVKSLEIILDSLNLRWSDTKLVSIVVEPNFVWFLYAFMALSSWALHTTILTDIRMATKNSLWVNNFINHLNHNSQILYIDVLVFWATQYFP